MSFEPLGARVVLRVAEAKTETETGLVLAPDAVEVPQEATVLAVGPACQKVIVGDRVLYPKYSGTEVTLDGELVLMLTEGELMGVWR